MDNVKNDFRAAMRGLAATVCLITASTEDGLRGLTATAVMSLSMDPPALAAAVNRTATLNPHLTEGAPLSIHLLAEDQEDLAKVFAGGVPHDQRFGFGRWHFDDWGSPVLDGAAASLSCVVDRRMEVATHSLLVAHVRAVRLTPSVRPLLYAHGEFTGLREAGALVR